MNATDDFSKRVVVLELKMNEYKALIESLYWSSHISMNAESITAKALRETILNRITFNGGKIETS